MSQALVEHLPLQDPKGEKSKKSDPDKFGDVFAINPMIYVEKMVTSNLKSLLQALLASWKQNTELVTQMLGTNSKGDSLISMLGDAQAQTSIQDGIVAILSGASEIAGAVPNLLTPIGSRIAQKTLKEPEMVKTRMDTLKDSFSKPLGTGNVTLKTGQEATDIETFLKRDLKSKGSFFRDAVKEAKSHDSLLDHEVDIGNNKKVTLKTLLEHMKQMDDAEPLAGNNNIKPTEATWKKEFEKHLLDERSQAHDAYKTAHDDAQRQSMNYQALAQVLGSSRGIITATQMTPQTVKGQAQKNATAFQQIKDSFSQSQNQDEQAIQAILGAIQALQQTSSHTSASTFGSRG